MEMYKGLQVKKPQRNNKILVLAPSQAGVEVIVQKLMEGISSFRTTASIHPKTLYLSPSNAVPANLKGLTFDTMVRKKILTEADDIKKCINRSTKELETLKKKQEEIQHKLKSLSQTGGSDQLHVQAKSLNKKIKDVTETLVSARDDQYDLDHSSKKRFDIEDDIFSYRQVICTTVANSAHSALIEHEMNIKAILVYDSDQCSELETLISSRLGCNNYVLFGNSSNPPTFGYGGNYSVFSRESLFQHLRETCPNRSFELNIQFRMHPDIFRFIQTEFIKNGNVRSYSKNGQKYNKWWHQAPLTPYRFFEVDSNFDHSTVENSFIDSTEALIVFQIFQFFYNKVNKKAGRIAIVSPFTTQVILLKKLFQSQLGESITKEINFKSSSEMAGQECDIVILSAVKSQCDPNSNSYIIETNLLASALTRSRIALWIVGTENKLKSNPVWRRLIADAKVRHLHTYCTPGYLTHFEPGSSQTHRSPVSRFPEKPIFFSDASTLDTQNSSLAKKRRAPDDDLLTENVRYNSGEWKRQRKKNQQALAGNNNSAQKISENGGYGQLSSNSSTDPRLQVYNMSAIRNVSGSGNQSQVFNKLAPMPPPSCPPTVNKKTNLPENPTNSTSSSNHPY